MLSDLECLRNKDESSKQVHKEETKARITSDNKDRKKLGILSRPAYTYLILSLTKKITFVMLTREKAAADVNANKAFESGYSQLKSLKESLPEGFISTTKKTFCNHWILNQSKEQR